MDLTISQSFPLSLSLFDSPMDVRICLLVCLLTKNLFIVTLLNHFRIHQLVSLLLDQMQIL